MGPVITREFEHAPSLDQSRASDEMKLLVKLATALQHYGAPAHRLERACTAVSQKMGLEAHFFSTPTAVFASFGNLENQRTYLLRVVSGDIHLERISQIDWVIQELMTDKLMCRDALTSLDELLSAPERFGQLLTTFTFGIASGTACRFMGGGIPEILVATVIGLIIGCLALVGAKNPAMGNVMMPLSAIIASSLGALGATNIDGFVAYPATVAGLIVLVPGLSFTTAMVELSTGHLASGTGRLAKALSMFLLMAFGIALGSQVSWNIPISLNMASAALPPWTEWCALGIATPAFAILFRAQPKDWIWVILAGPIAFYSARFGGQVMGPELGSFIASFTLGTVANLFARFLKRPAAIMMEPGIIFLVPGTMGLKSISALLADDPLLGIDSAFSMVLVAIALVIGILFANVVVPPRRSL
ncbi:MAG: threonine/serine exporter family protein [Acidobacteria bacterium]|nr:threonine/serine exporter family protein [Acidobacteriota bacterium]